MDFKDSIRQIAERIEKLKNNIQTEEATKNAFIMPFITALGYDVFNPLEVLPEMVCDIATKKGEKVDYAIMINGEPAILIECKHWEQDLTLHDNQLIRYFNISKAKFGILTNGIVYRFYSDLTEVNKMDEKPFFEINMLDLKDSQIEELKKFHKSYFDLDNILSTANELKYMRELKAQIATEFEQPSPELVTLLGKRIVSCKFTAKLQEQFTVILKRAISSHINDIIASRLKSAIQEDEPAQTQEKEVPDGQTSDEDTKPTIVTTEEEIEGFLIVKTITRTVLSPERITWRDTQSYFTVIVDDNNRKPICRLHFNRAQKYIGLLDSDKEEVRHKIDTLDDIFNFEQELREAASRYKE